MRREPSRSLHNLLHRPDELLHGKPSELLATHCRLAELSLRTFRTFSRELSSRRPTPPQIVPKELGDVSNPADIIRMRTTSRPQQRNDHRVREFVESSGDLTTHDFIQAKK